MQPDHPRTSGSPQIQPRPDRYVLRLLTIASTGVIVVAGGFGVVHATNHDAESSGPPGLSMGTAVVPAPPVADTGDGREARRTLPPVARGRAASPIAGLSVTVDSIRATQSNAQGPGMVQGPAVTVTVSVRNETGRQVRAPGGTMTVTYGPEDTPAEFSPQPDEQPVPSVLEPGAQATGSYTFLVPEGERDELTITFDYRPSDPAVVITGAADNGGGGQ